MAKKIQIHPMIAQKEEIDKRGLVVFDQVHSMPIYNEQYTTDYMTIGLNIQGWVKTECDMRPVVYRPHDIAILVPHHILYAHDSSSDYHAFLIVMSKEFQEQMKQLYPHIYRDTHYYIYHQDMHLNDEQFVSVKNIFLMLKELSMSNSQRRLRLLGNQLEILFILLHDYRLQNGIEEHHPSPREELFTNFYIAIENHYRESREVRFYADLFNLTPKYFATVIKQQTGTNASEWISSYVIIQAKALLQQRQLTVQQVALQLGFPDQSAFSRYFKKNVGISPTDYRDQN